MLTVVPSSAGDAVQASEGLTLQGPQRGGALGDLWSDWSEHYRARGIDPDTITRDGPADELVYREAKPRIVFVLKDSNAWPGHSLTEAMVPRPFRMMIMVARWSHGLLHDFPALESADDPANQIAAIRQVAAVNLKKRTGAATAVAQDIEAFAFQDQALLLRQLLELQPEILVACGTWGPLTRLLALSPEPGSRMVRDSHTGALVLAFRHPARCGRLRSYERLKGLIEHARAANV